MIKQILSTISLCLLISPADAANAEQNPRIGDVLGLSGVVQRGGDSFTILSDRKVAINVCDANNDNCKVERGITIFQLLSAERNKFAGLTDKQVVLVGTLRRGESRQFQTPFVIEVSAIRSVDDNQG